MDPVLCKLLSFLLYINTSASTDFNHLTSFSCKSGVPATNSLPGQTCLQGDEASAGADKENLSKILLKTLVVTLVPSLGHKSKLSFQTGFRNGSFL
jgi:hypothetical protein